MVGTELAFKTELKPTFALVFAGHTFPGYSAFYTLVLNLVLAALLTPVFNALSSSKAVADETLPADYHA